MRIKLLTLICLGLLMGLQGCGTLRGAKDGFKEDWKALTKADGWIREHMWYSYQTWTGLFYELM